MGTITRNFANNILGTGEVDATDGVNGTIPATNVADASLNNVTSLPSSVGYAIKSVASDPPSLNVGEIFYNSTAGAFKALVNVEAWSSGAPLSIARTGLGATGTQTAGLAVGGRNPTFAPSFPSTVSNYTEEYNGSGWSNGGSLSTNRYRGAAMGTQTAGLISGAFNTPGSTTNATEEYDGSTWTAGNNSNTSRGYTGGCGNQNAGLMMGGTTYPPNTGRSEVEEYDGTSWTAVNALPQTRLAMSNSGIQTAALAIGGGLSTTEPNSSPTAWSGTVESYDGTNWTASPSLNTPRRYGSGSGTQTNAYVFSGNTGAPSTFILSTEAYDGTSWSTKPSVSNISTGTNESGYGVVGSSNATYKAGGFSTTYTGVTEEYNVSTNTIVAAAWASGGSGSTARTSGGSSGVKDAAIYFGGYNATQVFNVTEEYNGSSWTAGGNLNTARRSIGSAKNASQTASLAFGGFSTVGGGGAFLSSSEEYDGSSWTAGNPLNTGRESSRGAGTQTAALAFSGYGPSSNRTLTEEYDGTTWTEVNDMNTARRTLGSAGTQTAALAAGGLSTTATDDTEEWDGTSWTSVNNMINNVNQVGSFGLQTSALMFADSAAHPAGNTIVTSYDGTTWVTAPAMASSRTSAGGAGASSTSGAGFFGGTYVNTTEEFTGETITQVAKTLSSS